MQTTQPEPPAEMAGVMAEQMGITEVYKSVSLRLPATLDELEDYCRALRDEAVAGITPVRVLPVDGHTVRLNVNIEESR